MKLRSAILFIGLFLSISVFSKDIRWKGGEGNWSDPNQWEDNQIPSQGDRVFIRDGKVIINKKEQISAAHIEVSGDAKFENGGTLLISNNEGNGLVIENFTIFKNLKKGIIKIDKVGEIGVKISNNAMLLNSGKIYIGAEIFKIGKRGKQIGLHGLVIENRAIFRNNCLLSVQNTKGKAVWNTGEAIFTNHKKIILGGENSLLQRHGIKNEGVFTNNKKGKIYIDGTYLDGIRNMSDGKFDNYGKIYLGKIKSISTYGIYGADNSDFRHQKGGKIYFYLSKSQNENAQSVKGNITKNGKYYLKKRKN